MTDFSHHQWMTEQKRDWRFRLWYYYWKIALPIQNRLYRLWYWIGERCDWLELVYWELELEDEDEDD